MSVEKKSCTILMVFILFLSVSCSNTNDSTTHLQSNERKDSDSKSKFAKSEIDASGSLVQGGLANAIEGTYAVINKAEDYEKCMITIKIEKALGKYRYIFNTESRTIKGDLSIQSDKNKDVYNITLEGIKWSEYKGGLTENGDSKPNQNLKLPIGIQGILRDKEITIQNYGNAMNSYVQLADCDSKYIILQKK